MPKSRLERYLDHLDSIFLVEPELFSLDPLEDDGADVICIVYSDIPETDMITGLTYGLSEVSHPEWIYSRPELSITIDSSDIAWPLAIAEMARNLRGICSFRYGNVINFGEQISSESDMSGFLIFASAILGAETALGIDLGDEHSVSIAGAYPIYDSERAVIGEIGIGAFFDHPDFYIYDPQRPLIEAADSC